MPAIFQLDMRRWHCIQYVILHTWHIHLVIVIHFNKHVRTRHARVRVFSSTSGLWKHRIYRQASFIINTILQFCDNERGDIFQKHVFVKKELSQIYYFGNGTFSLSAICYCQNRWSIHMKIKTQLFEIIKKKIHSDY